MYGYSQIQGTRLKKDAELQDKFVPEQHFSVWFFSNPGDNIIFWLKFNEARISEWNLCISNGLQEEFNFHLLKFTFFANAVYSLYMFIFKILNDVIVCGNC